MGHERLGVLPKSKKWTKIVESIAEYAAPETDLSALIRQTAKGLDDKFQRLCDDESVSKTFTLLLTLSVAAKDKDPGAALTQYGYKVLGERNSNSALQDGCRGSSRCAVIE